MEYYNSKQKIIEYLNVYEKARVDDLSRSIGVSRQIIHRHLKNLIAEGKIIKSGTPPLVFYELAENEYVLKDAPAISSDVKEFIDKNFLWVSASGELNYGFKGFTNWVNYNNDNSDLNRLAIEFISSIKNSNKFRNDEGLIDATSKFQSVFKDVYLNKIFYLDFYSLPKFGNTQLGQLVLYAKQSQNIKLINQIAIKLNHKLPEIIHKYKIDVIGIIPPTIPRKIQFLKELDKALNIKKLPKITLVKAYRGEIPIAQKTLSKLKERVENAKTSIFIKESNTRYKNLLLLDDAVGSGASMNEVANKIKKENIAKNVYGLAIVGSYKGFDVISEV